MMMIVMTHDHKCIIWYTNKHGGTHTCALIRSNHTNVVKANGLYKKKLTVGLQYDIVFTACCDPYAQNFSIN